MRGFGKRCLGAAIAAATLLPVVPAAAGPQWPICTTVAVSPDFKRDRTMVCAVTFAGSHGWERPEWNDRAATSLFVTTDGGRRWKERAALVSDLEASNPYAGDWMSGVWISPLYAQDKTIFVALRESGLYASTDLAKTFRQVDPFARESWMHFGAYGFDFEQLSPFVLDLPATGENGQGAGGPQVLFAYAGDQEPSALVDPVREIHAVAPGGPVNDITFAMPRRMKPEGTDGIVVDMVTAPGAPESSPALFGCTAALVCPVPLAQFDAGATLQGLWLAEDYAQSGEVFAVQGRNVFGNTTGLPVVKAWRSTDRGRSFKSWTGMERIVGPYRDHPARDVRVTLATNPRLPGQMYARVLGEFATSPGALPHEQIFRSTDGGKTFRRVGWTSYSYESNRRTGTLPWAYGFYRRTFALADDGTLVVAAWGEVAKGHEAPTVWCSRNGGSSWRLGCAR